MRKKGFIVSSILETILFYEVKECPFNVEIVLPNKRKVFSHRKKVDLKITVKKWASLLRMGIFGPYAFATEYVKGSIDIDGDLRILGYLTYKKMQRTQLAREVKNKIFDRPLVVRFMNFIHMFNHRANVFSRVQYNAEYHYGHEPEFYYNYLGPTMMYSTGFWYPDTKTIDEAQLNKWEVIFEKLRLKPGMRVCSVGNGFGFGEVLMAQRYGVYVDCYNVCRTQNKYLKGEIKKHGLEDYVKVYEEEYRYISKKKENYYDRLLVIECIEHAQDKYRFETIQNFSKLLKDDGIGIMQYLSYDIDSQVALFIRKYLYPGVTMPPLGRILDELAYSGFEIQDVLCNRRHYYYTLNAWYENMVENWSEIQKINPKKFNEKFRRTWQLYMASGAFYLTTPDAPARLYQITFTRGNTSTYPMNRDFIYNDRADDRAWIAPHPFAIN
jgi:cyclopropane-fatty-acyl-phospholipid synthase